MICVGIKMFLRDTERYIDMVNKGINVYICLDDGTELKLARLFNIWLGE